MARGRLRVFLGAVAGVGKTYAMLGEAYRRRERGTDVAVGFVETHDRAETAEMLRDLEVVPRQRLEYRGATLEEMDLDAVLARDPQLCLVDELAHTNAPGCRNAKRWQDVVELLDAGIDVLSTLNIQHLESLNDVVEQITGVPQRETIPDEFVRHADEIQLVEMTPEALRRRLAHGDIYPPERADAALQNFFRPGNLGALRELALMWVANRVDADLERYLTEHGIRDTWETRERVLVALTGAPAGEHVIRRAARIATRSGGNLIGIHVRADDGLHAADVSRLPDQRRLLESLGGRFVETFGDDVSATLLSVARDEHVTQIVLGASTRSRWAELVHGSVVNGVIRSSGDIDVHLISTPSASGDEPALPRVQRSAVSTRRRWLGLGFGAVGLVSLTSVMLGLEPGLELSTVLLLYLTLTVVATSIGGVLVAVPVGTVAVALADYYFTEPYRTFVIADVEVVLAVVLFAAVTALVSWLVDRAARRSRQARRAGAESAALTRIASTLTAASDPMPALVDDLVATFDLDAAAVLRESDDGWAIDASAGTDPPHRPEQATDVLSISDDHVLALVGRQLPADDRRVLTAFAGQLAVALTKQRLEQTATAATVEADSNRLRAALLSSVSHDLKTPLASIKAYASSLLQGDVKWRRQDIDTFARSIVEEADRLNVLIGNLLDLSRLTADSVQLRLQAVGIDDVIPPVLDSLPFRDAAIVVETPDITPVVSADPVLLDRILTNLLDNARRWSPDAATVTIRAETPGDGTVRLQVVDKGPGIPRDQRERVFQPFQRLGDGGTSGPGSGLGLAVARGFARAMGGDVQLTDTPGGGATATIVLNEAEPTAEAQQATEADQATDPELATVTEDRS